MNRLYLDLVSRRNAGRAAAEWDKLDRMNAERSTEPGTGPLSDERLVLDAERPAFVLHEHQRPQHHFDLRLEEDGVLRSWALPKGLPVTPKENRLAVQVDDHDLEHLTYTDADKSIADIGWWEEHDRNERRMVFTLHGERTAIRYALIQTAKGWLLHRIKDQDAAGNINGENQARGD